MKYGKTFLKAFSVLALVGALTACGNMNAKGTQSVGAGGAQAQNVPANYVMSKFTWDISSPNLLFTVVPNGTNFTVSVLRSNGQNSSVQFPLASIDSAAAYQMLQNVFSGTDGFIGTANYGSYSGSYSSMSEVDRNGNVMPTLQSPALYSGNNNGINALFSVIFIHL